MMQAFSARDGSGTAAALSSESDSGGTMSSTTCVIVDDHPAIAHAVESAFAETAVTVVGCAGSVDEAVRVLRELAPDVALVDLRLGAGGDGFAVLEQLHRLSPRTRAVVFTGAGDRASLLRAMDLGVEGFVLKSAPLEELVRAVTVAAGGGTYVDPTIARELAKPVADQPTQLTEREWEIIRLLAQGLGNDEIGKALFISPATVRTHLRNGMTKMGAATRAQAVAIAYADGRITRSAA
jgi:DNA-binding NarL/FixJ family response regulator